MGDNSEKYTLINIVQKLLKKNKISFDSEELSFQIQSHPSYPSLHAITGVMDHFNIENIAAEIPVDKETLVQLPDSFIAQITTNQGEELVYVERKQQGYVIFNGKNQKAIYTESKFLNLFTGIIIAVETPEENKATTTTKKKNAIRDVVISILIMLIGYTIYQHETSIYILCHLMLSAIGGIISITIIRQELGMQTTLGNAFCSDSNEKTDCDAVLSSKGAEILKGYKLSDLGILYFSTSILLTLAFLSNPKLLYIISILILPITGYSIYYQYKVIKKWCILCLSIVGILWIQAGIASFASSFVYSLSSYDLSTTTIIITFVWLTWYYLKPLISEHKSLKNDKIENNRFKRNFEVFDSLLQKSPQLDTYIDKDIGIVLGNPEAPIEIVLVTNPFCRYCKPVHQHIHNLLNTYCNTIRVKIRFNINPEDQESDLVKITTNLLYLYNTQGKTICLQAMNEIYGDMTVNKWLHKWDKAIDKEIYRNELQKQQIWCAGNAINFTPQIIINGKAFPKEYQKEELQFFIEDIEESIQQKQPYTSIKYYSDTILFN